MNNYGIFISYRRSYASFAGRVYDFLSNNKSIGPYANEVNIDEVKKADIIQLSFDGITFGHSLIIVDILSRKDFYNILVASHTDDSYRRLLSTYTFKKARFLKIEGSRK